MQHRRGVALVVVLLVIGVLATVALGLATLSQGNLLHSMSERMSLQALYAAQAGARRKVAEIKAGDPAPLPWTALPAVDGQAVAGNYTVNVTQGGSTAPNGFAVPGGANTYYVLATGRSTSSGATRQFAMLLTSSSSPYTYAAYVTERAEFTGNAQTDTFDSSLSFPYSILDADASKARLGTSKTSGTAFYLDNTSAVGRDPVTGQGIADIVGGPGSSESTLVSGPNSRYGTFQTQNRTLDPVEAPAAGTVDKIASGVGSTVIVTPGAYKAAGASGGGKLVLDVSGVTGPAQNLVYTFESMNLVDLGSQLELRFPGYPLAPTTLHNITIYVHNDVNIKDAAILNPSNKPERLQFKQEEGGKKIAIENLGTAYCVCYAPDSTVEIKKGSAIWGSVVARDLKLLSEGLGAAIHYDKSLETAAGGSTNLNIVGTQIF